MNDQENNINLNNIDEKQIIDAIKELEEEIKELKSNILKKEILLNELTKQLQNFQ